MATLNHPSFGQPMVPSVRLWRYMDLSKFAALLQRRALHFPRADFLGDPFEGSVPFGNAGGKRIIPPHKDLPEERRLEMVDQLSASRKLMRKMYFISCWHMNTHESAAMWRLYSKSNDAVCIQTTYEKLASALPPECYMGLVKYLDFFKDIIPEGNAFDPVLIKRQSFAHENEARAILSDPTALRDGQPPEFREIPVDLEQVVEAVFVSPEAPAWFRGVVERLAQTYGIIVPVHHSSLDGEPMY